jgi:cell division protein FtsW (lipid II flippase)
MSIGTRLRHSGLLLSAIAVGLLAFVQMILRLTGTFPARYAYALLIDLVLIIICDAILAWRQPMASQAILPTITLLSLIGITEITRIDYERTISGYRSDSGMRQFMWLGLAVVLSTFLVAFLRDYRKLRRFSYVCMAIGLILLISPEIPGLGRSINGARIWIHVGSFSLQPAEFAKLFLAVFFAAYLFDHRDQLAVGGKKVLGVRWPRLRDLGPIAVVWVISLGVLVLQHDLGTSLMFFAMFVGMLFVATRRKSWLVIGAVAFTGGVVLAAKLFPNFANRVNIWLHPFDQSLYTKQFGGTYQVVQGLFGLASGGLFGTGLGQGHPAITPFANSDFIYTSLGEEIGLTGLFGILVLYFIVISAGFAAAMQVSDGFGKLLASGLAFSMSFQIFTVIGGITLVIPLTGLTLPYLAAGGSSLIANWILAALLLIVSDSANSPETSGSLTDPALRQEAVEALAARSAQEKAEQEKKEAKQAKAHKNHAASASSAAPADVLPTEPIQRADRQSDHSDQPDQPAQVQAPAPAPAQQAPAQAADDSATLPAIPTPVPGAPVPDAPKDTDTAVSSETQTFNPLAPGAFDDDAPAPAPMRAGQADHHNDQQSDQESARKEDDQ